jgi:hypothetical protein
MFAELLASTSPNTAVDVNYAFALEAYNQFKRGAYDKILAKYREGTTKWDARKIKDFFKANPDNINPTRGQFLKWWIETHDLTPLQSNGKKFGMNSKAVLRVLDGSWRETLEGPKVENFLGNLVGTSFEATIDVWASRILNRLSELKNPGRWRKTAASEAGLQDADFAIGQEIFRRAAKELDMEPDSLQALVWFLEKGIWEKKGWTGALGAAKSDFNVLLKQTTRQPGGTMLQVKPKKGVPQSELDFGLKPADIKSKK